MIILSKLFQSKVVTHYAFNYVEIYLPNHISKWL